LSLNPLSSPLIDQTSNFNIGDKGPAGGVVFHVIDNGLHGMEAAPIDLPSLIWGFYGKSLSGATDKGVGAGKANTAAIIVSSDDARNAGKTAGNYGLNNFNDWYLPSKDELKLLYGQKSVIVVLSAMPIGVLLKLVLPKLGALILLMVYNITVKKMKPMEYVLFEIFKGCCTYYMNSGSMIKLIFIFIGFLMVCIFIKKLKCVFKLPEYIRNVLPALVILLVVSIFFYFWPNVIMLPLQAIGRFLLGIIINIYCINNKSAEYCGDPFSTLAIFLTKLGFIIYMFYLIRKFYKWIFSQYTI
jgi:hypothetical protein